MTAVGSWFVAVKIPATIVHSIAILATVFRLSYRWYLSRFWWEDAWAALALICDILCLCAVWMQAPPSNPHSISRLNLGANWILSINITSVLWFARISILCSIFRIANPRSKLRRIAYCIGVVFLAMEGGLVSQKIFICVRDFCRFTDPVAIAQLVTDVISDLVLVATSVLILRDLRLPRGHRILILLAFSASMLITVVTILHSILLFDDDASDKTIIIGHVKAALSLLVSNALVIVTFIYRSYRKSALGDEFSAIDGCSSGIELTSIIELPTKLSSFSYPITPGVHSTADPEVSTANMTIGTIQN